MGVFLGQTIINCAIYMNIIQVALKSFLRLIAYLIYDHYKIVALLGVLLAGVCGYIAATELKVVNDPNQLISEDSQTHARYLNYKREFNFEEPMVIVISSDSFEENKVAAEGLVESLSNNYGDEFSRIHYKHDFSRFEKKLLNFLTVSELEEIDLQFKALEEFLDQPDTGLNLNSMLGEVIRNFEDEENLRKKDGWNEFKPFIDDFIRKLNRLADELEGKGETKKKASQETDGKESLGNTSEVREKSEKSLGDMQRLLDEQRFITANGGKIVMILLSPAIREDNPFPYSRTVQKLRWSIEGARAVYPNVKFYLTGEPVLFDDELNQSTADSANAALFTFVLISILFFVAYRELVRPLFAIIALLCAVSWTMGFTALVIGHLNIISQATVIMILGLGIDFGIQLIGRFEEELVKNEGRLRDALGESLAHTGVAVLTSGSTTAVAFYTMCFNDFIGLAEFGMISGTGIIMTVIGNLILLPAMLMWGRDLLPEVLRDVPAQYSKSAGDKLDELLFKLPWLSVILTVAFSVFMVAQLKDVSFNHNLLDLQDQTKESVQTITFLEESDAPALLFGVVMADSIDEAKNLKATFEESELVDQVVTLSDMLPENQAEKSEILKKISAKLATMDFKPDVSERVDVELARKQLGILLKYSNEGLAQARKYTLFKQAKEAVALFNKLIPPLRRAHDMFSKLSQDEVGRRLNRYQLEVFGKMKTELSWLQKQELGNQIVIDDLPVELRDRYLSPNGKVLVEVFPKNNVWLRKHNDPFVELLRTHAPEATGTPVQNYEYIALLKDSYIQAAAWAFGAILILISIHFKDPRRILLTLLPLCLGILWTLGIMVVAGIPFNPANIITLPLVIGIGVAFGVYISDRHMEEGKVSLFGSSTGKAILLSAMTTMIGFGSMMTGQYQGLVSLGLVMCIGIFCCFLASTLVLPQILRLWDVWKEQRSGR